MGAKLVVVLGHTSCGALLAEGNSLKQAAAALGIGTRTVVFHEYQAMEALSVRSSAQLVRFAVQVPLVSWPPEHPRTQEVSLGRENLLVSSLLLCAAASTYGQPASAGENWVGSWKLNAAKSAGESGSQGRSGRARPRHFR